MSKELAVTSEMSYEEYAEITGQHGDDNTGNINLPRLGFNTDFDDGAGNELTPGDFVLDTPEHGRVYAPVVRLRPMLNRYQYSIWDDDAKEVSNESILFTKFRGAIPDRKGGERCGKKFKKEKEGLSPEQLEYQKTIKCYRWVFGVVSMDGRKADGTEVQVKDVPTLWRVRGSNYMPIGNIIERLDKSGHRMYQYEVELTSHRKKNGGITYYVAEPTIDMTDPVTITQEDNDLINGFLETVVAINDDVVAAYKNALKGEPQATDNVVEMDADLVEDFK